MQLPPIEWMEKAIRIPSVTHEGNEEIVRFLVPLLEEIGLNVVEQKIEENGETFTNIIAFNHSPDAANLMVFHTHLDTVSYGNSEEWTKTNGDPFRATRVRDRIYGLGTADVKLDFLCKIWAAKATHPWSRPIALVGSYGEERGLIGAEKLLKANKVKPKLALVGEPSNLSLVFAHKGHLICKASIPLKTPKGHTETEKKWRGKAAHSSTPHLGTNALMRGLTDIFKRGLGIAELNAGTDSNRIPDLCTASLINEQTPATTTVFKFVQYLEELAREFKKRRDSRFSPAYTTLSLNQAETKDGQLDLIFDVRGLPDLSLQSLGEKIDKKISSMGMKLSIISQDAPLKGRRDGPFMRMAAQALKDSGVKKIVKATKASSTEAALYQQHGAQAIVFGPGISVGNVHRPNEYNSISQMRIATQFYTHMMRSKTGAH